MTEKDIIQAYRRMREIDNTIPDEVLDFMKDASIEKLNVALSLHNVVGQSEQLVCDYCGKDKEEGLDHCKCYNGTTWVKKAN